MKSWRKGLLAVGMDRGKEAAALDSSPPRPCAEPAKSLLGSSLGRARPSLISDPLVAGHLGTATSFPPSRWLLRALARLQGVSSAEKVFLNTGLWGPRSCPGAAREKHGSPLLGGLTQPRASWPPLPRAGAARLRVHVFNAALLTIDAGLSPGTAVSEKAEDRVGLACPARVLGESPVLAAGANLLDQECLSQGCGPQVWLSGGGGISCPSLAWYQCGVKVSRQMVQGAGGAACRCSPFVLCSPSKWLWAKGRIGTFFFCFSVVSVCALALRVIGLLLGVCPDICLVGFPQPPVR